MITLTRVKNVLDKENKCPENCACEKCRRDNEFVVRENLTDEEIEEIINSEYSDKNELTKNFIRKALHKYGDKFTYYKTNLISGSSSKEKYDYRKKVIITCRVHGDFEIYNDTFFRKKFLCIGCKTEKDELEKLEKLDKFEKDLSKVHPYYKVIPGVSIFTRRDAPIQLHCEKHNLDFSSRPDNLLQGKHGCEECKKEVYISRGANNIINNGVGLFKKLKDRFKDRYDFSESIYSGLYGIIKFKCNTCGNIIEKTARVLYDSLLLEEDKCFCDTCKDNSRKLINGDKLKKDIEKIAPGKFDLTNLNYEYSHSPVSGIKCLSCGKEFTVDYIHNFLSNPHCPNCEKVISMGENLISNWIESHKNSIDKYTKHLRVDVSVLKGRKENFGVIIDFEILVNGIRYWVEYNGSQHYMWFNYFHKTVNDYREQLIRDKNVREYCSFNKIIFIEIPYTYHDQKSIDDILNRVLLRNENTDFITIPDIDYSPLNNIEEAKKNGKL